MSGSGIWWSAGRILAKQINRVVQTLRVLANDALGTRTHLPHTSGELARSGKSFDELASLLETRSRESMKARARLRECTKAEAKTAELARANEALRMEVAEHAMMEKALRGALTRAEEVKSRFESIIAGMSDGLVILDREFKVVYRNEIAGAIFGDCIDEYCYRAAYDRDDICEQCPVRECFNDGKMHKVESVWRVNDETAHVELAASPLRDESGEITGAIILARDISQRKRAEEELRSSEERFKILFESAKESQRLLADIIDFLPDATFVIDREGSVIAWNRAMEEMTGTGAEAMLGKGGYEYALPFYGERRPLLIDLVLNPGKAVESNGSTIERTDGVLAASFHIPDLRGREVHLFGTARVLYDSSGNVTGAIQSIRDVTSLKLMEKAISTTEERFRAIFENSITGMYQITMDGRFLNVNKSLASMLGYDSSEELLSEAGDVRHVYVHPERRAEFLRLIEEHGSVREFQVEFFRKDKSVGWVAVNARAVRTSTGEISCLECTASDITDRKLLKAQLDQAQRMEAIGTLAGGIAHDFNNILTPIIGYSELSLGMVPEEGKLSHNMRQVLVSANRAKDLVKQILTFSRKTEQEKRPVQVSLLVKEALKLLRSSLPSTIEIRQFLHPDAIESTTMADPTRIHQVLMNLCTNAAHAMRAEGGTLTISMEDVEIGQYAGTGSPELGPGPYLRLSVMDTGHGMNETIKQRIFDPYFTTKGPNEGTGLGLAVVYGIVKDLSGAIDVTSEPGKGATFDVYLPRTKPVPALSCELSEILPTGHGLVLVVDDEKFIVDMVKEMLETLGYETVAKYSSYDALEAFRARPQSFDLIITDMTMPHMTGLDLAREILTIRPRTPMILCTGFSEMLDEKTIKQLGFQGLLLKPVSTRDLAVAASRAVTQTKN